MYQSFILEGPDNAGKSTLAAELSTRLKMHVYHQGRPGSPLEFFSSCTSEAQPLARPGLIYDRSMAISQLIYDSILKRKPIVDPRAHAAELQLVTTNTTIVFCLPPKDLVVNVTDREEMEGVAENRSQLYDAYAKMAEQLKDKLNVTVYDYTKHTVDDLIEWLHSQDLQYEPGA